MPHINRAKTTVNDPAIWTGTTYMNLYEPNPAEIHLGDIARALSRLCRFNGFGARFYSVAEHLVNCLEYARQLAPRPDIWQMQAILMHDATEAYLGDVTSPLKALLPEYRALEAKMAAAINRRFRLRLDLETQHLIKHIDKIMLATEKQALMSEASDWPEFPASMAVQDFPIRGCEPDFAARVFLFWAAGLGLH